jgi:hypothetical protein
MISPSLFDANLYGFRLDSVRDHCQLVMANGNHVRHVEVGVDDLLSCGRRVNLLISLTFQKYLK